MAGLMSTPTGLLRRGWKWWQRSLHQLPRWWHHLPLGGLHCSNYQAEILAICTAAEHLLESGKQMGNIAIFTDYLSTLQALNSADPDQMIQGLHSSLAKLTAQHSVSLQWVPSHVRLTGNERADRLFTYREAKTLHSWFNGDWKNENGGYRAHLDQFRDWNGPSRSLSSACIQGTVVWEPIWRGLEFQTLPCVSADKLTKPQITSFSPAQNKPRDVS